MNATNPEILTFHLVYKTGASHVLFRFTSFLPVQTPPSTPARAKRDTGYRADTPMEKREDTPLHDMLAEDSTNPALGDTSPETYYS